MRATTDIPADLIGVATARGGPPLIAHVIFRLDVGGLENGLVNLINRIPAERYRHVIVSLTDSTEFRLRIRRKDVPVFALNKPAGNSPLTLCRLWQLFRRLRPRIVHTRNLGALEAAAPAAAAGVPVRIHGEHGRDVDDLDGLNSRRRIVRRLYRPFVHHYVALSQDLASYLHRQIGVPPSRIARICNGVDTAVFHPASRSDDAAPQAPFPRPHHFVIGTVGRMQPVKDQITLAKAFVRLMRTTPEAERRLRLVMVGDGPLLERVRSLLAEAGMSQYVWLPGKRDDVAQIMRGFDLFVLPSLAEGISNTILEAMATGLPVVATDVGGNAELVQPGRTGMLVPRDDPETMASALGAYAENTELCRRQGTEARQAIESKFGMETMVNAYVSLYDALLTKNARRVTG